MMIPNSTSFKTVTDMREDAVGLLRQVQNKQEPTLIMHRNNPKAVLMSVSRYNQLMDMLEDYRDGQIAREYEMQQNKESDYVDEAEAMKQLGL